MVSTATPDLRLPFQSWGITARGQSNLSIGRIAAAWRPLLCDICCVLSYDCGHQDWTSPSFSGHRIMSMMSPLIQDPLTVGNLKPNLDTWFFRPSRVSPSKVHLDRFIYFCTCSYITGVPPTHRQTYKPRHVRHRSNRRPRLYALRYGTSALKKLLFSAQCNRYISRLCYDVSDGPSVRLSVCLWRKYIGSRCMPGRGE